MSGRIFTDPQVRFFEDFQVGDVVITRSRTVGISDITNFATLTGDYYPLHIDEESAKKTRFGTRIAHGPLTFSLAVGLVGLTDYYGDAIVALKEITNLRATKPVLPDDTLHVRAELQEADGSENPKYGTITMLYSVINQHDDVVMTFKQTMLAKKNFSETDNDR